MECIINGPGIINSQSVLTSFLGQSKRRCCQDSLMMSSSSLLPFHFLLQKVVYGAIVPLSCFLE